jgi:hypothetical protein
MDKEPSFEELMRTQQEHQQKVASEKAAAEEERKRVEQQQAEAETGYERRAAILEEAGLSQAEIAKMKAAKIEERMASSDKLRESAFAKEEELKRTRVACF